MSNQWIQTVSGRQVWPLDIKPDQIDLGDIAHALSLRCRFNCHVRDFYSVAQHSVHVMQLTRRGTELFADEALAHRMVQYALLHDATEAYLPDIPRPIKGEFRVAIPVAEIGWPIVTFKEAEARLMRAVCQRFKVEITEGQRKRVEEWDSTLLATEARDLMAEPPAPWETLPKPLHDVIEPWSPGEARCRFLEAADELDLK